MPATIGSSRPVLLGVDLDMNWTDLSRVNWLTSMRGRIGFLPAWTVLLYFTGGAAWSEIDRVGRGRAAFSAPTHRYRRDRGAGCTFELQDCMLRPRRERPSCRAPDVL